MDKPYSQTFAVGDRTLCFDSGKSILLCRESKESKNLWIKKINDVSLIDNLIEDSSKYYLSCELADNRGYYLALNKATGATEWFIPGKAYFQIIYDNFLYLIFADEKKDFYLLQVDRSDGKKTWYHRVAGDLCEYSFRPERILLKYESGKTEKISPRTGAIIR